MGGVPAHGLTRAAAAAGLVLAGLLLVAHTGVVTGRVLATAFAGAGFGSSSSGWRSGTRCWCPRSVRPTSPFTSCRSPGHGPESLACRGRRLRAPRALRAHPPSRRSALPRVLDIDTPWPQAWSAAVEPVAVEGRSPLTAWWWTTLPRRLSDGPLEAVLWRMRAADAVLTGLAALLAAVLLAWLLPGRRALLALGLLAAPTLPFYGMFWSDSPVILAAAMLLGAALAPVVMAAPRAWMAGIPIGLTMTLAILSGRRAWPLVIASMVVLVGRACVDAAESRGGTGCCSGPASWPSSCPVSRGR
ncbi:MAG: hypothetical protein R2712_27285 [Vicinamibacterales bacterium]